MSKIKTLLKRYLPLPAVWAESYNKELLRKFEDLEGILLKNAEDLQKQDAQIKLLHEYAEESNEKQAWANENITSLLENIRSMILELKDNDILLLEKQENTSLDIIDKLKTGETELLEKQENIRLGIIDELKTSGTMLLERQENTMLDILSYMSKNNQRADSLLDIMKSHTLKSKKSTDSIIGLLKNYDYYKHMSMRTKDYQKALENLYESKTGKKLNLNAPQTFSEKMYWLKLYDNTSVKSRLACKYTVREYVRERIGEEYLVPLLGVWDSFDEIDFNKLPDRFVLKCTHGWDMNIIVKDKSKLDMWDARYKMNSWLNHNLAFDGNLQQHCMIIPPRIIAEEYMENTNGDLYDYKFWCFNGNPLFVYVVIDRQSGKKVAWYDTDWKMCPFRKPMETLINGEIPQPRNLEQMINISKALSKGLYFVRVDLYLLDDGSIKFGEMTFHPSGGTNVWDPPEYDLILGEKLKLPINLEDLSSIKAETNFGGR